MFERPGVADDRAFLRPEGETASPHTAGRRFASGKELAGVERVSPLPGQRAACASDDLRRCRHRRGRALLRLAGRLGQMFSSQRRGGETKQARLRCFLPRGKKIPARAGLRRRFASEAFLPRNFTVHPVVGHGEAPRRNFAVRSAGVRSCRASSGSPARRARRDAPLRLPRRGFRCFSSAVSALCRHSSPTDDSSGVRLFLVRSGGAFAPQRPGTAPHPGERGRSWQPEQNRL